MLCFHLNQRVIGLWMHVVQAFTPGGTVSQHVVSHASCPVLVLPAKAVS